VAAEPGAQGESIKPVAETQFADEVVRESIAILKAIDTGVKEAVAAGLATVRDRGGRLFILGVGGSAGHASHAVTDFRQVIGSRHQQGHASLDYRHEGPRQEPLLWLADALAGAVRSQIRKDNRYVAALPADRLTIRTLNGRGPRVPRIPPDPWSSLIRFRPLMAGRRGVSRGAACWLGAGRRLAGTTR
jgi:hypothetical protein